MHRLRLRKTIEDITYMTNYFRRRHHNSLCNIRVLRKKNCLLAADEKVSVFNNPLAFSKWQFIKILKILITTYIK